MLTGDSQIRRLCAGANIGCIAQYTAGFGQIACADLRAPYNPPTGYDSGMTAEQVTPEEQEDAWMAAAVAEAEEWEAAGRPGGTVSHEIVMAEMFGDAQ